MGRRLTPVQGVSSLLGWSKNGRPKRESPQLELESLQWEKVNSRRRSRGLGQLQSAVEVR
jgi:hypothetical protein